MAVAQAQNGHAQLEHCRVHMGGSFQINAVWPAGKDNTDGVFLSDGLYCGLPPGKDFAVNAQIPDTAGDQLIILAAKVYNQNDFVCQKITDFPFFILFPP